MASLKESIEDATPGKDSGLCKTKNNEVIDAHIPKGQGDKIPPNKAVRITYTNVFIFVYFFYFCEEPAIP